VTRSRLIVLIALACGLGTVVLADVDTSWSPVVYPAQRLPLAFSHGKHLGRGKVTCATCHPSATTSRSAVDNLIPTEAACRACHPIDRAQPDLVVAGAPPAKCIACHPGFQLTRPVERVYLTPTPLKFDHAAHAKQSCESCHGDMTKVDLATTKQLPTMASCLTCHNRGAEERRCGDCHLTKLGGLIETDFPHGTLVPAQTGLGDQHGAGFAKDHKQEARQVGASCTACHDRSECAACHQGVVRPMDFHPGNYISSHGVEARRGTPDCSACHRAQSFCVACHERTGVGRRGEDLHDATQPGGAFHPSGWATEGVGPNRHAGEARRNISACASCHREDDCLKCHTNEPGRLNASPHPKGWRGSARCKALDSGNRRMCLKCHITQDELGCDWSATTPRR
jgi:hypothetical protein